jgi:hypothetical protein
MRGTFVATGGSSKCRHTGKKIGKWTVNKTKNSGLDCHRCADTNKNNASMKFPVYQGYWECEFNKNSKCVAKCFNGKVIEGNIACNRKNKRGWRTIKKTKLPLSCDV